MRFGDGEYRGSPSDGARLPARDAIGLPGGAPEAVATASCRCCNSSSSLSSLSASGEEDDDAPALPAAASPFDDMASVTQPRCCSRSADQSAASASAFVVHVPCAFTRFVAMRRFEHFEQCRTLISILSSPFHAGSFPGGKSVRNARFSSSETMVAR